MRFKHYFRFPIEICIFFCRYSICHVFPPWGCGFLLILFGFSFETGWNYRMDSTRSLKWASFAFFSIRMIFCGFLLIWFVVCVFFIYMYVYVCIYIYVLYRTDSFEFLDLICNLDYLSLGLLWKLIWRRQQQEHQRIVDLDWSLFVREIISLFILYNICLWGTLIFLVFDYWISVLICSQFQNNFSVLFEYCRMDGATKYILWKYIFYDLLSRQAWRSLRSN